MERICHYSEWYRERESTLAILILGCMYTRFERDEDNYRLVTSFGGVVSRSESDRDRKKGGGKPSVIASLSSGSRHRANGWSAALARLQRDHVESGQRNPYIWPDSVGLGRREPIVLVPLRSAPSSRYFALSFALSRRIFTLLSEMSFENFTLEARIWKIQVGGGSFWNMTTRMTYAH